MAIVYLSGNRIRGTTSELSSSTTTTAFQSLTGDQVAMNPENSQIRRWGYRIDANNALIGGTITSVSFTLNKASGATGTLSVWVGASSTDSSANTKIGSVNLSAIGTSYAAHAFTGTGTKAGVAAGDFIFIQNDADRDGNGNTNIKVKESGSSAYTTSVSNMTTAIADAGGSASYDGRAPSAVQSSGDALAYTMTVVYYAAVDGKSTIENVPAASRYEETDTNKIYHLGDAWTICPGTLSAGLYLPAGSGDKTDGWTTTGQVSGNTHRNELDKWNGTTWADSGHDCNINLNASTGNGSSSAITVAGSSSGNTSDDDGCTNYNGTSWTQKTNTPESRGYACSGGTSSALIWCGGAVGGVESNAANSFSLSGNSWTSEASMPTQAHMAAGDGTAVNTMFVAGGKDSGYADQNTTQGYDGSSWSSSPAVLSAVRSQCVGGGHKTAFWIMAGNPSALRGVTEYYNGTAWASKPDTLLAISGSGGANNGATNPLVSGGKFLPVNGNWTTGQYFGLGWAERDKS